MTYTEPTRRAVAQALGREPFPGHPHGRWKLTADLEALDRMAAEAQGWTADGPHMDGTCDQWTWRDGPRPHWIAYAAYTPTTNDGQALALFSTLGPGETNKAIRLLHEWCGCLEHWLCAPALDRPVLLTAAAVLASRGEG